MYFFLSFLLAALGTGGADYLLVNHDSGNYLVFAQEFLKGKHFYRDIVDTNTPLITYMTLLPVLLHKWTGMALPATFFIAIFIILEAGLLLSWRIIRRHPLCRNFPHAPVMLLAMTFSLFIMPLAYGDFGQREHLMCALILPYVMLAINRMDGINARRGEQIAAGCLGAAGFSIKPHFALIFILSECFIIVATRRLWAWQRLESVMIGVLSAVYYVSFIAWTPEYFTQYLHYFIIDYRAYESPWKHILFTIALTLIPPLLGVLGIARRHASQANAIFFMLQLIVSGEIIYGVEKCSYPYHLIPVFVFTLILLTFRMLTNRRVVYPFASLLLFFSFIGLTGGFNLEGMIKRRQTILSQAAALEPYSSVIGLSTSVLFSFPVVNYTHAQWQLRMSYLQYLPSAYLSERSARHEPHYHSLEEMSETERFFHEQVILDLEQLPAAIFIDESPDKQGFEGMPFDLLHYFMADARFRQVWRHYAFVARNHNMAIYRRVDIVDKNMAAR